MWNGLAYQLEGQSRVSATSEETEGGVVVVLVVLPLKELLLMLNKLPVNESSLLLWPPEVRAKFIAY